MSAQLVLTAAQLRGLTEALDVMSGVKRKYGVGPGGYDEAVHIDTEDDTVCLSVDFREVDGLCQYVINDRYGS